MSKALIVYGSETGNTKSTAHAISAVLRQEGIEVSICDAKEVETSTLCQDVDLTLLGSSSRGDRDTISFPPSFAPLYEQLNRAEIRRKKLAIFGCGDSTHPYFCGAVELLQEKIGDLGGELVHPSLRIDGDPLESAAEIRSWSRSIAQSVHHQSAQ